MSRTRGWCFTSFDTVNLPKWDELKMKYLIWGVETCPTTGKLHLQGFVYFYNPVTLNGSVLKKLIGTSHREPMRGTALQASTYCKKEGKFEEFGTLPNANGVKLSLEQLMEMTDEEIIEYDPRCYKALMGARNMVVEKRAVRIFNRIKFIWLHGPTGTGKTRFAFDHGCECLDYHNGYFSDWTSKSICIEEWRKGYMPITLLLRIADGYHGHYKINVKGKNYKRIDFDLVVITSPLEPENYFPEGEYEQLLRRLDYIIDTSIEEWRYFADTIML